MALLMYQRPNQKLMSGCGGTLISTKHVLTGKKVEKRCEEHPDRCLTELWPLLKPENWKFFGAGAAASEKQKFPGAEPG